MSNYSEKTRKKCNDFANAIDTDLVKVNLQITRAEYITTENLAILSNLMNDFVKEQNINTKFEEWLRTKAMSQTDLF